MQETTFKTWPVPVTIPSAFPGPGKTTLLNRILNEHHGGREPAAVERLSQGLRAINPRETIIDGLKDCHA